MIWVEAFRKREKTKMCFRLSEMCKQCICTKIYSTQVFKAGRCVDLQKRENYDVYWADRTSPEAAGPLSAKNVCDVMKKL